MALPEGWYQVAGDPAGTRRFWDGAQFVGGPEQVGFATRRAGFVRADNSSRWRLAGWFTRALALLIDAGAPIVIITGIAVALGSTHPGSDLELWRDSPGIAGAIIAFWAVNQIVLIGLSGRSLGHVLLGMRIVRFHDRARSPGLVHALVRALLLVPGLPVSIALFLLGHRRGLHDYAAGTCVVYA